MRRWLGWVVGGALLVAPTVVDAGTWAARARWQPSADSGVIGFRIYTRRGTGALTLAADTGTLAPAADGSVSTVVGGLAPCAAYGFAVSEHRSDGSESPLSNEIALAYAAAAGRLDGDHDGLTNASEDRDLDCIVDAGETDPDRADSDADGVLDGRDACQGTAAGTAVNTAGCSCAQVTCDDANVCNGRESCSAGVCQRGTPLVCNDGNACTADSCDAARGCVAVAVSPCVPCTTAATCDDGNRCTADSCTAGRCQHASLADGSACDDGNACNGHETCGAGSCRAGRPLDCADGNACTADRCDAVRGCQYAALADGTGCDDGNVCNGRDTCGGGTCQHGTPLACNDGNTCTTDRCDALRGCVATPIAGCVPCATAAACDDANRCTNDSCVGGLCRHAALLDGSACDDGLFCNGAETCRSGACSAGRPVTCDDGTSCTADDCDEAAHACRHEAVPGCCTRDVDCALDDRCRTNARCEAGRCTADPVVCPDAGPCLESTCDPAVGCGTAPLPDGTPCDDGDVCTPNEVCSAGVCSAGTVLAIERGAAIAPTHLNLRTSGRGLTFTARAAFTAPELDLVDGDVQLTVRDETGSVRFEALVAGARFTRTAGGAALYREDHRAEGGGFTIIELRRRGGWVRMAVRAAVVRPSSAGFVFEESRAVAGTSATLEWVVRTGWRCVNGSGQCKGRGRRCR